MRRATRPGRRRRPRHLSLCLTALPPRPHALKSTTTTRAKTAHYHHCHLGCLPRLRQGPTTIARLHHHHRGSRGRLLRFLHSTRPKPLLASKVTTMRSRRSHSARCILPLGLPPPRLRLDSRPMPPLRREEEDRRHFRRSSNQPPLRPSLRLDRRPHQVATLPRALATNFRRLLCSAARRMSTTRALRCRRRRRVCHHACSHTVRRTRLPRPIPWS